MLPQTQARKPKNSSKMNLLISFIFHALIIVTAFYFAARNGLLGKQLRKIAVEMVKEKKEEKPKEPEKPNVEPPKIETPKEVKMEAPKMVDAAKAVTAPPAAVPAVAPPAAELPAFDFEGGKTVETSANPVEIYRGLMQSVFTSKWNKPDDLADDQYVAEVEVSVGPDGEISHPQWLKGSGNTKWDDSVRKAVAAVNSMDRKPPKNFPSRVTIRFDVAEQTEPVLQ